MQPNSLSAERGSIPPKAALNLWGAQSERPLPCNIEVVVCSPSDAIWQQPSSSSPPLPLGTADGGTNVAHSAVEIASLQNGNTFKLLLQRLESEHDRQVCQLRAELEKQLAGARQGVEANTLEPSLMISAGNQSNKTSDGAVLNEQFDAGTALPQGDAQPMRGTTHPSLTSSYSAVAYEIEKQRVEDVMQREKRSGLVKRLARDPTDPGAFRKVLAMFEASQLYGTMCAIMIILNTTLIGVATDLAARTANPYGLPRFFTYTDVTFSMWFLFELALRVYAHGVCHFLLGREWTWNIFDILVVGTDVVEVIATILTDKQDNFIQNVSAIRMLRVLRIVRTVKVIRLVRLFKELRMMVFSILKSGVVLLWSLALLCIVVFIFSMYLTQSVTFYIYEHKGAGNEFIDKLHNRFGSLTYVGYVLFQCITGGLSWGEVSDDLLEIHWTNAVMLCFFVFFTLFAVMNVVAGIFVETAIRSAQEDRHEVIQEALYSEQVQAHRMQKFFQETDFDHNGTITLNELKEHLEIPQMRLQLRQLGIEVTDATSIFHLLDHDQRGELKVGEFVFGCLQMQGSARSIDLIKLIHENRRLKTEMESFFTCIKESLQRQQHLQHELEKRLFHDSTTT